jgi:hypothetical protein
VDETLVEGWIELVFGPRFRLCSRCLSVLAPFLLLVFVYWLTFAFGAGSACYGYALLGIRDDSKDEEEDGGTGEQCASH